MFDAQLTGTCLTPHRQAHVGIPDKIFSTRSDLVTIVTSIQTDVRYVQTVKLFNLLDLRNANFYDVTACVCRISLITVRRGSSC